MDNQFTDKLREWLETPENERDLMTGANLLLQLTNNQIMYRNIICNIKAKAEVIEYNIRKYYNLRLQAITNSQVSAMESEVKTIAKTTLSGKFTGKRPDHDSLPESVIAIYKENLTILRKMQDLHRELASLETKNVSCPASEKYPFVREIIRLDKQYHANWETYDKYSPQSGETALLAERKTASVNALRFVNLNKGRYKKNPTEALKSKIIENFNLIIAPSEALKTELKELGVL